MSTGTLDAAGVEAFIAYKREDRARLIPFVQGLQQAGISVWWDQDMPGGARWRQTVMEHLAAARCVIVVWSEASVSAAAEFVHDEATYAKTRGVLLPVRIDKVTEPLGFGQLQSLDLTDWTGDTDDPRFKNVVEAARALIAGNQAPRPPLLGRLSTVHARGVWRLLGLFPRYVGDLAQLTSGPKQFLASRLLAPEAQWPQGLLFLLISQVLTFLFGWGLVPSDKTFLYELSKDSCFLLTLAILYGCAAYVSWRTVGAKLSAPTFFMIHFYMVGVIKLMMTAMFMTILGALRLFDSPSDAAIRTALRTGNVSWFYENVDYLLSRPAVVLSICVALLFFGSVGFWFVLGWGAYRKLAGVSKVRSMLAFLVFCLFSLPVIVITFFISLALL